MAYAGGAGESVYYRSARDDDKRVRVRLPSAREPNTCSTGRSRRPDTRRTPRVTYDASSVHAAVCVCVCDGETDDRSGGVGGGPPRGRGGEGENNDSVFSNVITIIHGLGGKFESRARSNKTIIVYTIVRGDVPVVLFIRYYAARAYTHVPG